MPLPKANSKSFFGNSLFIFIIRFFPSLANLLVMIWYSKRLPLAQYGEYQHFWIQLNLIYPFACLGIHVLLMTYSREFIMKLLRKVTAMNYLLLGAWCVGLSIVFALLQTSVLGLNIAVPFFFIFGFTLTILFESFLIVCRNYVALTLINGGYAVAYCILHWYVWAKGFSLNGIFTSLLVLVIVRLILYSIMAATNMRRPPDSLETEPKVENVRTLWFHLAVFDISQILFNYIDKFIISVVLTAEMSAVYYNGAMTIPFLPLLLSAAGSAVLILTAGKNNDEGDMELVGHIRYAGRLLSCVVFPVFFFLLSFRYEFIITVFSAKYSAAVPVFTASILVLPVKAYSFTTALQKKHLGAVINKGAMGDLILACLLMYPFYLLLGLPGVALSFVFTTYLQAAYYLYHASLALNTGMLALIPYANWVIKLIVFATLFIGIHYMGTLYFTEKNRLILGGAVMALAIAGALWMETRKTKNHVISG